MHLTMNSQHKDGLSATMCIERSARHCEILCGTLDEITTMVQIARSMNIPLITISLTDPMLAEALESLGWKPTEKIVLEKDLRNGT
jgi:hypothetical protein